MLLRDVEPNYDVNITFLVQAKVKTVAARNISANVMFTLKKKKN